MNFQATVAERVPEHVGYGSGVATEISKPAISVIGLGYVGAVSMACLSHLGFRMVGVDVSAEKVQAIKAGKAPIVEERLGDLLADGARCGLIDATQNCVAAVLGTDVTFLSVGTPTSKDGGCDFTYVRQASRAIGQAIALKSAYHVVVLRCSVPPGTTLDVVVPEVEKASGKKLGVDFGVCFNPEFLREGVAVADFFAPPKTVVGASDTFNYESAGYQNTLGMYKIAADGTISGVQILFANASLKGDGGDLVSGVSSVDVAMKAGERIGFFVVPDGFAQKGMAALLNDKTASFKFVDGSGKPGNVNAGSELKLVQVAKNGTETVVKSAYGSTVFHSVDDGSKGLNGDGMKHVVGNVNNLDGTVKIGFEDLKGGGDKDFDDSVFTVNIGVVNSSLLAKEATKPVKSSDKDDMKGGTGNDVMFGMSDDDKMDGGAGDDQMWGNAGADRMRGGEGNDDVRGGKDDDVLWGEAGDDKLAGNTGNDTLHGGDGRDTLSGDSGNDVLSGGRGDDREIGGSGDDVFLGGAGNDTIEGGSGFDTLDYRHLNTGMAIDLSKHTATGKGAGADTVSGIEAVFGSAKNDTIYGDKNANVIDGSAGNDVIRGAAGSDTLTGGEGSDTFVWSLKDVGAGKGVDHITDFSKDDKLNLHELLKGQKFSSISDVVKVTDTAEGSKVSVKVGGAMVDVTVLDGVHNASAVELLKAGMILA